MNEFFEMPEKSDKRGFFLFDSFEGLSEALVQCGCRKLQVREVGWKFDTSLPQEVRDEMRANAVSSGTFSNPPSPRSRTKKRRRSIFCLCRFRRFGIHRHS